MDKIQYRFSKMDLTQFSPEWDRYDASIETVGIESNFSFSFNKTDNVIRCITKLIFIQENQIVLKSEFQTYFEISKESIDEMTKDHVVVIPKGLLCQFASLSYGSYRGVLYMKTINTVLDNLILPPLYLDEVIKEDISFVK